MERINELELQKANLEKAYKDKEELANAIANDIALLEQLINAKRELANVRGEMNNIVAKYNGICKAIEEEKATVPVQETPVVEA